MYARIATFEDADAGQLRAAVDAIRAAGRPPEGVDSHGISVFSDPSSGRVIVAGLFETREALDRAHEVLSAMSPPSGSFGKLLSVDLTEVVMQIDMSSTT